MTAMSRTRSRTDCAIAFAVTSSIVKNTAAATIVTMRPMLPIWFAKPCRNALSVVVRVSVEEFANSVSICADMAAARFGSSMRRMIQPTSSRAAPR